MTPSTHPTLDKIITNLSNSHPYTDSLQFSHIITDSTITISVHSLNDNYTIDYNFDRLTNTVTNTETPTDPALTYDNTHHFILSFFDFYLDPDN